MTTAHTLGYPRLGARRELKKAMERYWRGELDGAGLYRVGKELRARHWRDQAEAGLNQVSVGDFSWYDHMLDMSALLGVVPGRFDAPAGMLDIDTYFRMARGRARTDDRHADVAPYEMTKWFDTNYHYLVPELHAEQQFAVTSTRLFDDIDEAIELGYHPKPILIGPLTFLWLAKTEDGSDRLDLLPRLLETYRRVLEQLSEKVDWLQIDEPILVLDLPDAWREAFARTYNTLADTGPKMLLTTYFGGLGDNLATAMALPVDGLHIDVVRAPEQVQPVLDALPSDRVLSLGLVNGRNVWRTDLDAALELLRPIKAQLGERLWLAPSCSLLHCPVDVEQERDLDAELRAWLAFSRQKLDEIVLLKRALDGADKAISKELATSREAIKARRHSTRIHVEAVSQRLAQVDAAMLQRNSAFSQRGAEQHRHLNLPRLPTTTIGSFPQTQEIRRARRDHRAGRLSDADYVARMHAEIERTVKRQEAMGLDVLVHGEPERNDMVEYFGELLGGFAFTRHGWVQSYGSRGVKPPIIYGDVSRPAPMTVEWSKYAQSVTQKPMKGMLTGPVTIVQWSFVRDDQPHAETARQIALALRDEVVDLEAAGIGIIQIDEPALREGLPLRRDAWQEYLDWAVDAFRLASAGVADRTQIHTHMCYAEFNDIIDSIARLDADVISLESSRSRMELLEAFEHFDYPNEIGPGVYDIHSPRVPSVDEIETLLERARQWVPAKQLWVNPDCGLKTRGWDEVEPALSNMVAAARQLRSSIQ